MVIAGSAEFDSHIAELECLGRVAQILDQAGNAQLDLSARGFGFDPGGDDVAAGVERAMHLDPGPGLQRGEPGNALEHRGAVAADNDHHRLAGNLETQTSAVDRLHRAARRGAHQQLDDATLLIEAGLDLLSDLHTRHRGRSLAASIDIPGNGDLPFRILDTIDDHAAEARDRAADHRGSALCLRYGGRPTGTAATGSQGADDRDGANEAQELEHVRPFLSGEIRLACARCFRGDATALRQTMQAVHRDNKIARSHDEVSRPERMVTCVASHSVASRH